MFRNRLYRVLKTACIAQKRPVVAIARCLTPVSLGLLTAAACEADTSKWSDENFSHEFLIRQATTVNVNAATQLLTVTLVAIQDTSERLRDALSKEISLVQQAIEWGEEGTPPHHWDQLVAIRGLLDDLNHNLGTLTSYMDYAEKIATVAAEISYLSGNVAASDAICERIDQACRSCKNQKQLTQALQQECLELQQRAIINAPQLEEKLKQPEEPKLKDKSKSFKQDKLAT